MPHNARVSNDRPVLGGGRDRVPAERSSRSRCHEGVRTTPRERLCALDHLSPSPNLPLGLAFLSPCRVPTSVSRRHLYKPPHASQLGPRAPLSSSRRTRASRPSHTFPSNSLRAGRTPPHSFGSSWSFASLTRTDWTCLQHTRTTTNMIFTSTYRLSRRGLYPSMVHPRYRWRSTTTQLSLPRTQEVPYHHISCCRAMLVLRPLTKMPSWRSGPRVFAFVLVYLRFANRQLTFFSRRRPPRHSYQTSSSRNRLRRMF